MLYMFPKLVVNYLSLPYFFNSNFQHLITRAISTTSEILVPLQTECLYMRK